jgi:hypothetical protein
MFWNVKLCVTLGVRRCFSSGSGTGSTRPRECNWGVLERKSSGSGLECREYGRRDPLCWPRSTLYPQKLALTSPTSGGRSVGIVRSRTQATEFSLVQKYIQLHDHDSGQQGAGRRQGSPFETEDEVGMSFIVYEDCILLRLLLHSFWVPSIATVLFECFFIISVGM